MQHPVDIAGLSCQERSMFCFADHPVCFPVTILSHSALMLLVALLCRPQKSPLGNGAPRALPPLSLPRAALSPAPESSEPSQPLQMAASPTTRAPDAPPQPRGVSPSPIPKQPCAKTQPPPTVPPRAPQSSLLPQPLHAAALPGAQQPSLSLQLQPAAPSPGPQQPSAAARAPHAALPPAMQQPSATPQPPRVAPLSAPQLIAPPQPLPGASRQSAERLAGRGATSSRGIDARPLSSEEHALLKLTNQVGSVIITSNWIIGVWQ